jgi:PIN domain nuclease of toxin-antitoxin system
MGRQSLSAIILDTHALLWLVEGHSRLGKQASDLIEAAAHSDTLFISSITPWEIALLASKGRIEIEEDILGFIEDALTESGAKLYGLTPSISVASLGLEALHGDRADRIIVATSLALKATLITEDCAILDYARLSHLKVRQASL